MAERSDYIGQGAASSRHARAFPAPGRPERTIGAAPGGQLRWPPIVSLLPGGGPGDDSQHDAVPTSAWHTGGRPDGARGTVHGHLDWLLADCNDAPSAGATTSLPTTGLPTTGLPTTGLPTTGFPEAAGLPTTGLPEAARPDAAPAEAASPEADTFPNARRWHGAGGRWLVWLGRAVIWAVLILIGYRGVMAIADGPPPSAPAATDAAVLSNAFPETLAEAYALQFGSVYLNFSPSTAAIRSQELGMFLPRGSATQLGWNGAGTQQLLSEQVASVSVTGRHTAVVTLLARLDLGRMIELAVPVYADDGAMSVSGDPALLPAPRTAVPPAAGSTDADPVAQGALQSQLPAFFQAYAAGDRTTLARFTWPGTHLTGLNGDVSFGGIDSLYAPPGGTRRAIRVTVTWDLAAASTASGRLAAGPAALQMTYQMTVRRQHGSWDVQAIGASSGPKGQP
jgi:hypothetical protein